MMASTITFHRLSASCKDTPIDRGEYDSTIFSIAKHFPPITDWHLPRFLIFHAFLPIGFLSLQVVPNDRQGFLIF